LARNLRSLQGKIIGVQAADVGESPSIKTCISSQ
jgi:hypothetical protein